MIRTVLALVAAALAGAGASASLATPLADEDAFVRALPRLKRRAGPPLTVRKATEADDASEAGPVPVYGTLLNLHTDSAVVIADDEPTRERFSELLEDKGMGARIPIAPRLLELLRAIARAHPGVRIDIVSGYRSAKRNEMMRKKGHHVASKSQHTLGHAVDFRVEGLTVSQMVKELERLKWDGGIGRYYGKSDRFVHADVGPKRTWRGE